MNIKEFDRPGLDAAILTHVRSTDIVLDIGCGIRPQGFFQPRLHICCEPYHEYVDHLRQGFRGDRHVLLVQRSGGEFAAGLADASVDSIFLIDVIEHLTKDDGAALLRECGRVARQQIVVFTPLGFMPQEYEDGDRDGWGLGGGVWQTHRSGWLPEDFGPAWEFLVCPNYHEFNGKGERFSQPFGAFWAIKNIGEAAPCLPRRLAVLSPAVDGPTAILNPLLRDLDPGRYCVLTPDRCGWKPAIVLPLQEEYRPLSAPYHVLAHEPFRPTAIQWQPLRFAANAVSGMRYVRRRATILCQLLQQLGCDALMCSTAEFSDVAASDLAARRLQLPLYVYAADDYGSKWTCRFQHLAAKSVLRRLRQSAATVLVPEQSLAALYERSYGITAFVVGARSTAPGKGVAATGGAARQTAGFEAAHSPLAEVLTRRAA